MLRVLERGLRAHGFEVTGVEALAAVDVLGADEAVGIVLLDLALAAPATRTLVEAIRARRARLPLLFLTARDDDPGGDEYLAKPFAMETLIGRIRARTRSARERRVTMLTAGDVRLDLLARCAWRGERMIELPAREFALLEYFMRHPGRVLSRPAILADVWGYDLNPSANSNVVDVYVRYLRNRVLSDADGDRSLIATVRGAGYQFNPPPASASGPVLAPARSAPRGLARDPGPSAGRRPAGPRPRA